MDAESSYASPSLVALSINSCFRQGLPDLPKTVPGVAWQVTTCPAADCSTVMASAIS